MKPTDFLIGVRDFFTRLVPGALFLLLFPPAGFLVAAGADALGLLTFAIAAYLVGSVAAGAGGALDGAADWAIDRSLFRRLFAPDLTAREGRAEKLRDELLAGARPATAAGAPETPKVFWWDYFRLHCPAAIAELDRIEAAQKLFRSLIAVFVVIGAYGIGWEDGSVPIAGSGRSVPAAAFFALALLAIPFYVSGRQAFRSALCRLAMAWSLRPGASPDAGPKP